MLRSLCVLFAGMPMVAFGGPWVAVVPEHHLGCSSASMSTTDSTAINTAEDALLANFTAENLVPGAAEPAPDTTPDNIRLCFQLGFAKPQPGSRITTITVPANPVILMQCDLADLGNCKASIVNMLGSGWTGRMYAMSIYRWTDPSGKPVGDSPQTSDLVQAAAGLAQPPHEPEGTFHLVEDSMLLVAPAPPGMTAADLQAKINALPNTPIPSAAPVTSKP